MQSRTLFKICASATFVLGTWLVANVPARAGTIGITYSFTGAVTSEVVSGNFLDLTGVATGSVNQFNPLVNAVWNPVTFDTVDAVNLTTGLDNGTFTMTFANGDMLSGLLFEDDSVVLAAANQTGPFTQTLTFTAGTGEFAGVTGFTSGGGLVTETGYTDSGSGTLTAPGLIAPEPGSLALVLSGMAFIAFRYRRRRTN